jgi:hypothetical protein
VEAAEAALPAERPREEEEELMEPPAADTGDQMVPGNEMQQVCGLNYTLNSLTLDPSRL